MIPQLQQLTDFWTSLKSKACITFKDWEELQEKFSKAYQKCQELESSRKKWKERSLLSESMVKQKSAEIKGLNKQISDSGGKER